MSQEEKNRAKEELARLIELLEGMGVDHRSVEPYYLYFENGAGECMCFPSQTEDGKLVVAYQAKERHDNAEQVLMAVGLLEQAE